VLALAYDQPRSFDEEDRESAVRMTAAMSVALNNARMFEIEHHIADRLQEALLALPDEIAGVEFARAYHSATEAARVGGDFYDIFELGDHYVGITIGDISGKGIDAAMLTALVKNTIRAHASEKGKTPTQVLALTNHVVYRSTPSEAFATVLFAVFDRRDGRLVYANAGHTTGALGTRTAQSCGSPRLALFGGFEHSEFGRRPRCSSALVTCLFLYTDGLTEVRRGTTRYGEERVFTLPPTTRISSAATSSPR
jgi:serine phosphatase RsbU (regulator of sigma subunit)